MKNDLMGEEIFRVPESMISTAVPVANTLSACIHLYESIVKGEPKQVNPMDKPAGVIAVSGAGNYSSSLEMVKAMFLENCAVIHKPHKLNEATDRVWEKNFQPLVDAKAIAFCDADQGGR